MFVLAIKTLNVRMVVKTVPAPLYDKPLCVRIVAVFLFLTVLRVICGSFYESSLFADKT